MNKLLPCPFCGGVNIEHNYIMEMRMSCTLCKAQGPTASSHDKAEKAWDTRTAKVGVWECVYVPKIEKGRL